MSSQTKVPLKTRTCNKCKRTKPIGSFHRDRSRPGGRAYMCKPCQAAQHKKYHRRHKRRKGARLRRAQRAITMPGHDIAIHENSRSKAAGVPGTFTGAEFYALCLRNGFRCLMCGKRFRPTGLTADHIVPISKGGVNFISNIQPLCGRCNSSKGTKTMDFRDG